ncbi:Uncharacterised protein [Legionella busanensis]|uniref:Uncharacterized protein n=1 Tax=Legionella busanensis TaxID=190655 RepID=A0A378KD99_9GAMM|nr:hypothetical protein [Legionella busanensis]STX81202.1 Uncharacterised protein [Legionella busanensis]
MFRHYKKQMNGNTQQKSIFMLLAAVSDNENRLYGIDASIIFHEIPSFQIRMALENCLKCPNELLFDSLTSAIEKGNQLVNQLKKIKPDFFVNTPTTFRLNQALNEAFLFQILEVKASNINNIKSYIADFLKGDYKSLVEHSYFLYNPDASKVYENNAIRGLGSKPT